MLEFILSLLIQPQFDISSCGESINGIYCNRGPSGESNGRPACWNWCKYSASNPQCRENGNLHKQCIAWCDKKFDGINHQKSMCKRLGQYSKGPIYYFVGY